MIARTTSFLLAALWLAGSVRAESTIPVGNKAEKFTLKVINVDVVGKPILSLDHLIGERAESAKKVVVISFFATYCEPCKRELPFLQKLHEKYADKGLAVLVVSIDKDRDVPGGTAKVVGELAAENKLTYPVLHDRFNILAKRYGVSKLPCLYLIDSKGVVTLVNVGYTDDFSATLAREIQTRLGVPQETIGHPVVAAGDEKKTH